MEICYPAHIRIDENGIKVQSCSEHCQNTAKYASESLESVGLSACGRLIGLLHDSGKYSAAFKDYLERASQGLPVRRGSVNHSSAGLRYLLERYHTGTDDTELLSAELFAYAVGAHHGLFDCHDGQKGSSLDRRTGLAAPLTEERVLQRGTPPPCSAFSRTAFPKMTLILYFELRSMSCIPY